MDDIVEDARREVEVMLNCWQTQGNSGGIFRNHIGDAPSSEASSEYYTDEPPHDGGNTENGASRNNVRFVISDLSQESSGSSGRLLSVVSPGTAKSPSPSDYFAAEEGTAGGFDFRRDGALSPGISPLRNVVGEDHNSAEDVTPQS